MTARGWEDLSKLMQVYEQLDIPVDESVILQYIQNRRIAKDFANIWIYIRNIRRIMMWMPLYRAM